MSDGSTTEIESLYSISGARNKSLKTAAVLRPSLTNFFAVEDCSDWIWHSPGYLGLSSSFCFDLHNLWNKVHKDQSVQLYFTEPVSRRWYEQQLANMVQKLGLDSSECLSMRWRCH